MILRMLSTSLSAHHRVESPLALPCALRQRRIRCARPLGALLGVLWAASQLAGSASGAPSPSTPLAPPQSAPQCPPWEPPAGLGGPADASVTLAEARRWRRFRAAREAERHEEARAPERVAARYRISQAGISAGCYPLAAIIDLGRGLFLRRHPRAAGFGHGERGRPTRTRLQSGELGGPDASACVDCHWKGGFAGAGDRVDNSYLFGDGEHLSTSEARNPPALWGSGWVQALAQEMSRALQRQRAEGLERARRSGRAQRVSLESKGISFGSLTLSPSGRQEESALRGVAGDLTIRPFGWRGDRATLRAFLRESLRLHFSLEASPEDLDGDGVADEISEGQLSALSLFLATLDTPLVELPTRSISQSPPFWGEPIEVEAPALSLRWARGATLFQELGCADCHRPTLPLEEPIFKTCPRTGPCIEIDLSESAARPHPPRDAQGRWLVPLFSDLRWHRMGAHLSARGAAASCPPERCPPDRYLTRRLWGLRNTSPYLHTGGAERFEEVILMHGGEGSEAQTAAESYQVLEEGERASLHLFLSSLSRGPALRIR